jgi:hypothetical protein
MADEIQAKIQNDTPIWGAARIAREVGLDRAQAYHLLSRGLLPARRVGRRWVTTRDRLRQALTGDRGSDDVRNSRSSSQSTLAPANGI